MLANHKGQRRGHQFSEAIALGLVCLLPTEIVRGMGGVGGLRRMRSRSHRCDHDLTTANC